MGLFNRKILMKEITNSVFFKVLMSMIKRELPYVVGGNIVGENEPEDILLDLMISESKVKRFRPDWKKNWWVGEDGDPNPSELNLRGLFSETEENTDNSPEDDDDKLIEMFDNLRKKDWLVRDLKIDKRIFLNDFVLVP